MVGSEIAFWQSFLLWNKVKSSELKAKLKREENLKWNKFKINSKKTTKTKRTNHKKAH